MTTNKALNPGDLDYSVIPHFSDVIRVRNRLTTLQHPTEPQE
jgi:hypothetical protein